MPVSGLTLPPVAADTARAAETLLRENSPFRVLGGALEPLFAHCRGGLPVGPAAPEPVPFLHRSVATLLQVVERLTDVQAAEAMRTRVDWKLALHLPLNYPGLQPTEFCRFRQRLMSDAAAWRVFRAVAADVNALTLWPDRAEELDHIEQAVAQLCTLNQVHWHVEAMAQAIEALATCQPEWLRKIALPHWYARYTAQGPAAPKQRAQADLAAWMEVTNADVAYLLAKLAEERMPEVAQLPEIRRLRRPWQQVEGRRGRAAGRVDCSACALGACIANGCSGYGLSLQL